jgi:hypothetical protein
MPIDNPTTTNVWNDPLNPWPSYSQLTIVNSASALFDGTYNLSTFELSATGSGPKVAYTGNSASTTISAVTLTLSGTDWILRSNGTQRLRKLSAANVPWKEAGVSGGWEGFSTTWSLTGLSAVQTGINYVPSSRTPWESRRLRVLGII